MDAGTAFLLGFVLLGVLSFLVAALCPLIILVFRKYYSSYVWGAAWIGLGLSVFLWLAYLCESKDILLVDASATSAEVWLIKAAGFLLAFFSFALRPRWLGWSIGLMALLAWTIVASNVALVKVYKDQNTSVVDMGAGMDCRKQKQRGIKGNQYYTVEEFSRHGLVSKRIFEVYTDDGIDWRKKVTAAQLEFVDRCELAISHASRK